MKKRVAVFGGSFNPPGVHHRHIVEVLKQLGFFQHIVIVPCGPRPDKLTTNDILPIHRATMCDLTLGNIPGVEVDLFDLEQATFTRTHELERRYHEQYPGRQTEIWHVVGPDLIAGGRRNSFIATKWQRGQYLWSHLNFLVIASPRCQISEADLPPHSMVVKIDADGGSTVIRETIFRREDFTQLVTPEVAAYINRYNLYRGGNDIRSAELQQLPRRIWLRVDHRNPRAISLAQRFQPYVVRQKPELIVVIGGDGLMLQTIHRDWRRRLPFYGINAGYRGFLLNEMPRGRMILPTADAQSYHLPLLYVEQTDTTGKVHESLAFNDAWVERASGQTGWFQVLINDRIQLKHLIADGLLVSTAAGSTAYARAMGATPLPPGTPNLCLVGSNVLEPPQWKMANLQADDRVEIRTLNPQKRPVNSFVDGVGPLLTNKLTVRTSRIAAVELVLNASYNFAAKLTALQFPSS
ncbi:MAG: hypothetical protein V1846_01225 [Candidatus Komeilibacteria bacterium]